jgi:probable HAF family extracellular repeat protein
LWRAGVPIDLGILPGALYSSAYASDVRGRVVGESGTFPEGIRAVLWQDGAMSDLGTLPGHFHSDAAAINNVGQIAGTSWSDPQAQYGRGVTWRNGTILDLGTLPGGTISEVTWINDRGQVVGAADTSNGAIHVFLWEGGVMRDAGPGVGFGVNNRGQIVGHDALGAFVLSNGVRSYLGTLPGGTFSVAAGITDRGEVVGVADNATGMRRGLAIRSGSKAVPA